MKAKQYDFIDGGLVDADTPPGDSPVVAEDAAIDADNQSTFEGQEFQKAHHTVLAKLIGSNWNHVILFSGKQTTVMEMMAHVAKHTPTGNKFVSQVSGVEQLD
jgi:hypothetical protein